MSYLAPITTTAIGTFKEDYCTTAYTGIWSCNAITVEEKDNKKTFAYDVAGLKIKGDKIFENKTKNMKLHFYGEGEILNVKKTFDETIVVDTNIYNKYDWYVSNGILYVILFEKINKEPEFVRVEKPKKVKEEENK